jgi:hypothetical protein
MARDSAPWHAESMTQPVKRRHALRLLLPSAKECVSLTDKAQESDMPQQQTGATDGRTDNGMTVDSFMRHPGNPA